MNDARERLLANADKQVIKLASRGDLNISAHHLTAYYRDGFPSSCYRATRLLYAYMNSERPLKLRDDGSVVMAGRIFESIESLAKDSDMLRVTGGFVLPNFPGLVESLARSAQLGHNFELAALSYYRDREAADADEKLIREAPHEERLELALAAGLDDVLFRDEEYGSRKVNRDARHIFPKELRDKHGLGEPFTASESPSDVEWNPYQL